MNELEEELCRIGRIRNFYFKKSNKYRRKRNMFKLSAIGLSLSSFVSTSAIVLASNLVSAKQTKEQKDKYDKKYTIYRNKYNGYNELYKDIDYALTLVDLSDNDCKRLISNIKDRIVLIEKNELTVSFEEALMV